ncbi:hypothetical protein D9756_005844 [Leucocoprinus leucothites]|uniref:Tubulin-specific chaperone A n=1 Tax=Leucocoprinus leucothites TaxID=201217 RepID=A0A8H5D2E6_9AGAR|nr:hypothetical protein D9756_005844 [Leucoagaricus leucothites]
MSEIATIQKQLKIKSGSAQRYEKEVGLYQKEVHDLQKKLDKFVSDGADSEDWDIKNTKRMMEESNKMILDTKTRLGKVNGELSDLVKQVEGKPGVADTEEFKNAQQILKKAESSPS